MKLSFSQLGNYGRLGNQMFEVAGTIGLAAKHNAQAVFPAWRYSQYFKGSFPVGAGQKFQIKERHFHYHDWNLTTSCDILGYLQSEKYFTSREDVLRLFAFKDEFAASVKAKVPSWVWDKPTICFQIRRGDYVGNPNYYQLSISYYIDALLTHFPKWEDYNIVFFSDEVDYCKVHFECLPNAYFAENLTDIEQMCLATMLDHFIIPNSSFGWWCAYLGEKPHSKIIHCGHLQAGKLLEQNDPKDYWPERWTRHEKARYQIDLKDVTFTIPVSYDHPDRQQNLSLCVSMLQHHFDTNIAVMEQGGERFKSFSQWCKYSTITGSDFHRTRMLNLMALDADTPYISNWDADVIISPMQIYLTVQALRNGADFVYPYDGRFSRLDRRSNFDNISRFQDIGMRKGGMVSVSSVGGAVFCNRNSFIQSGGENEYMISYAPEDVERWERWNRLGYKVQRIDGHLYHINHYIGRNSSTNHPKFKANMDELERERAMSVDALRDYCEGWPWFSQYTAKYYRDISQGSAESAVEVFNALAKIGIKPKSVLDVGCGVAAWFQDGIVWIGVDHNIPAKMLPEKVIYHDCDLSNIDAANTFDKVDMVICMEVAEHLPETVAGKLVEYLCSHSDIVLFSAAIPNQGGQGHINEQWQTYWADLFALHGYGAAKKQPDIRGNKDVALWYRQNTVLYVKGGAGKVVDYVLPEYYIEIANHLKAVANG